VRHHYFQKDKPKQTPQNDLGQLKTVNAGAYCGVSALQKLVALPKPGTQLFRADSLRL
jgi:hypothetical protein